MNQGCLFVISAPSGAGKTTIVKPVLQTLPAISFSVSHTTRQPRPGELDGNDYHFVSKEQFEKVRDNNGFLEWAEVHGNYYGTSQQTVTQMLGNGNDIILDIDVQGAAQLREKKDLPATFLFIAPPSLTELEKRLLGRQTETPESLQTRLHNAKKEMQAIRNFSD